VTGLSKNKSIRTHQLLLSTEIFSKTRKIYLHFEEMSEYTMYFISWQDCIPNPSLFGVVSSNPTASILFHSGISFSLTSHQLISFILIYFLFGLLNSFIECYKAELSEIVSTSERWLRSFLCSWSYGLMDDCFYRTLAWDRCTIISIVKIG